MFISYEKIINNENDFNLEDLQDAFKVAGYVVHAICNYTPENEEIFFNMLQFLMGPAQELSNLMKSSIKDRMNQNEKWPYIGKSYFKGATLDNDYTPSEPLTIEVNDNPYSYTNEGYARLLLKSGGADSERILTLRKMKDGRWVVWSDSIVGLLTDIRKPESTNPWA
jgi:hypothetical protein